VAAAAVAQKAEEAEAVAQKAEEAEAEVEDHDLDTHSVLYEPSIYKC
jgi:hypothetical protein